MNTFLANVISLGRRETLLTSRSLVLLLILFAHFSKREEKRAFGFNNVFYLIS